MILLLILLRMMTYDEPEVPFYREPLLITAFVIALIMALLLYKYRSKNNENEN